MSRISEEYKKRLADRRDNRVNKWSNWLGRLILLIGIILVLKYAGFGRIKKLKNILFHQPVKAAREGVIGDTQ